jgi:hypothetical protein
MKPRHVLLAVLALGLSFPSVSEAQQARISPTLSTSMKRVCDGKTTSLTTMAQGSRVAGPRPEITTSVRGLSVSEASAGRRFEQTVEAPTGDVSLTFVVTPQGRILDAELSGPALAGILPEQRAELARNLADDVPEKLLLNRSFVPGSPYYPDDLRDVLIGRMTSAFGLPFPVEGSLDVTYRGEVDRGGRRAWLFEGPMTTAGQGDVGGVELSIAQDALFRVHHDVETGLVLDYELTTDTRISVDGRPFGAAEVTDAYVCRIVAQ